MKIPSPPVHRKDFDLLAKMILIKDDIGWMTIIGRRYTDHSQGFWSK
jgi:hypothetical protein